MNDYEAHQQELEAREQYEHELWVLKARVEQLAEIPDMRTWLNQFERDIKRYEAIQQTYHMERGGE